VDITDEETDINILFEMALQKLAFMPFAYIVSFEETFVFYVKAVLREYRRRVDRKYRKYFHVSPTFFNPRYKKR